MRVLVHDWASGRITSRLPDDYTLTREEQVALKEGRARLFKDEAEFAAFNGGTDGK